jgi:hypothetical protein
VLLSNLFVHHKPPQPKFAPGLFLALLAAFVLIGQTKPVYGLVGIGTTAIVASVLILLNRDRIWEMYQKTYKKQKGVAGMWTRPNRVYYTINVYLLWPFVLFLGLICLWAAYAVS